MRKPPVSFSLGFGKNPKISFERKTWYAVFLENLADLICPCCSWRGHISSRLPELVQDGWYGVWHSMMVTAWEDTQVLMEVDFPQVLEVSETIWPESG